MRKLKKIAGIALVMGAGVGVASAAPALEAKGRIEHLNPRGHHVTIASRTYRYDPRFFGPELRRGETVRVLYRERHGHRYVLQILPAV